MSKFTSFHRKFVTQKSGSQKGKYFVQVCGDDPLSKLPQLTYRESLESCVNHELCEAWSWDSNSACNLFRSYSDQLGLEIKGQHRGREYYKIIRRGIETSKTRVTKESGAFSGLKRCFSNNPGGWRCPPGWTFYKSGCYKIMPETLDMN